MRYAIFLTLLVTGLAHATGVPIPEPSTANASALATSNAVAETLNKNTNVNGAEAAATNEGNTTSTLNQNSFYSLALEFPQISHCFIGGQGGGGDDDNDGGTWGFLGINFLSSNCWMDFLASKERDVEINALLKCGGKKYRNAIAFDQPKRERQRYCVDKVTASGKAMVQAQVNQLTADLLKAQAALRVANKAQQCVESGK